MKRIFVLKEVTLTLEELVAANANATMLINSLAENGIHDLADLLEVTDAQIRRMPKIGFQSHEFLVDALANNGLHLKVRE